MTTSELASELFNRVMDIKEVKTWARNNVIESIRLHLATSELIVSFVGTNQLLTFKVQDI